MNMSEGAVAVLHEFTVPKAYPSRPGTSDSGKEYEVKVAALLMIRTINQTETKHTWVAINVDQCGAFDDIVLCRQTEEGDETFYLIQLKHGDKGGEIDAKQFMKKNSAFLLTKYFNSISEIKREITESKQMPKLENENDIGVVDYLGHNYNNIVFILFTNKETTSDCTFLKSVVQNSRDDIRWNLFETINTSDDGAVFEFDYEKLEKYKFEANNFFLFTKQYHINELDNAIANTIKQFIRPVRISEKQLFDISLNFLHYLDDWSKGKFGGHYPLTKLQILKKLIELLLEAHMVKLGEPKNRQKFQQNVWTQIIEVQDVVYINEADIVVMQFMKDYIHSVLEDYCAKSGTIAWWKANANMIKKEISTVTTTAKKIPYMEAYQYLWKTRKVPLLLEVNDSQTAKQVQDILKISQEIFRVIVLNKSDRVLENLNDSKIFNNMADLDECHQKSILLHSVTLQGRQSSSIQLVDVVDNVNFEHVLVKDVVYILCGKFSIGEKFETLPEFFEEMTLTRVWLDVSVLLKIQNEMFVILCTDLNRFNRFLQSQTIKVREALVSPWHNINNSRARIITVENEENLKEIENYCSEKSKICHFLIFDDIQNLEWVKSTGTVENIKSFRKKTEIDLKNITTMDLLNDTINSSKFTLICSEAGMGKSVLMNYMAHNTPLKFWVLKINLAEYKEVYKTWETHTPSSELFSIFVHTTFDRHRRNNNLNKAIFQKYLKHKNVILLMDGFDEIPISYQTGAKKLIKYLHDSGHLTFLTTRPVLKAELELLLNTFSVTLNLFTRTNQEQFLKNHFAKAANVLASDERIISFVNQLLDVTKKNLNDKDNYFVGVPIQTSLLAQVYVSDCTKYLETGNFENNHFDSLYLYKHFIQEKMQIARCKIEGISEDTINQYKICRSFYALRLIFPENNLESLGIDEKMKQATELFPLLMQLIQKDGIIVAESEQEVTFANRTFAEYLAAEWLAENMDGEHTEVAKTLVRESFHPNFDIVHNIFDRILAENCPLHLAILNRQAEEVKRIIQSDFELLSARDKGNRIFLHLIASWGLHHSLTPTTDLDIFNLKRMAADDVMVRILNLFPDSHLMKTTKDCILGYTPLDYALSRGSLNIANVICRKLKDAYYFSSINMLNDKSTIDYIHKLDYTALVSAFYKFRYNLVPDLHRNAKPDNACLTSLHGAIENGNIQQIRSMVSDKTIINKTEAINGYSPLHVAVIYGFSEVVGLLLSISADPNKKDNGGRTALHWALCRGVNNETDTSVEKKKRANETSSRDLTTMTNAILSFGGHIDVKDNDGNTALLLAANNGHECIISFLLSQGSEKDVKNNEGDTALSLATYNGYSNIVRLLLTQGCDKEVKNNEGNTAINIAASRGHFDIVSFLLSQGSEKETKSNNGNTPLITAASNGYGQAANLFLLHGCDKEAKNNNGDTALTLASYNGHTHIVYLLLSEGSYEDAKNYNGDTALILAAENGHASIVNLLLTHRANIDLQNTMGFTALINALCYERTEVVNMLLAHGCNKEIQVCSGNTALMVMATFGKTDFVKLLLSKGSNRDARNNIGNNALHMVAFNGHAAVVRLLLEQGSDIDVRDFDNNTALIYAANNGHTDVVDLLLVQGGDKDAINAMGNTALISAVANEHVDVVNLLLSRDCNQNVQNIYGNTALFLAACNGHLTLTNLLLEYGSDQETKDQDGDTALIAAANIGHTDIVNLLLSRGSNKDAKNNVGNTASMSAAYGGYIDIVNSLLSYTSDANAKSNCGDTALIFASRNGHTDVVKALLSYGCDENAKNDDGDTALISAAQYGHYDVVNLLLSHGSDVEARNNDDNTALIVAAATGNTNAVYLLLSAGANTETRNSFGNTALTTAVIDGHANVVTLLLSYGSDKETKTKDGNSPLMLAAREGCTNMVNLLLSQGADKESINLGGDSALMAAANSGHIEIVTALLFHGCDKNRKNNSNSTALILAAYNGHADVVKLLLADCFDINAKNNDGNTALTVAAYCGHVTVISLLLADGANTETKNNYGNTALIVAACNGHHNAVTFLLSAGAKMTAQNNSGDTALVLAASNGHTLIVSLLLCQGSDKETRTNVGNSALASAARSGHVNTVNLLLSQGANKEAKNNEGKTAVVLAASFGHTDVVTALLREGSNKETKDNCGNAALSCAAINGHFDVVKLLLSEGCDKDAKNYSGSTTLNLAAAGDRIDIVNLLLEFGCDKEAKDDFGNTALMVAAMHGHANVARVLLSGGSNKEAEDIDGNTAFILSAIYGHTNVLELLLSFDVNKEAKNNAGNTALTMATFVADQDVLNLLLAQNCDKEVKDNDYNTPLILSVIHGNKNALNLLLCYGANIEAKNITGNTALTEAACKGDVDVVKLLLIQGADTESKNNEGDTALTVAVQKGDVDIVNLLLDQHRDYDTNANDGNDVNNDARA